MVRGMGVMCEGRTSWREVDSGAYLGVEGKGVGVLQEVLELVLLLGP
jgi:hypothetical protein